MAYWTRERRYSLLHTCLELRQESTARSCAARTRGVLGHGTRHAVDGTGVASPQAGGRKGGSWLRSRGRARGSVHCGPEQLRRGANTELPQPSNGLGCCSLCTSCTCPHAEGREQPLRLGLWARALRVGGAGRRGASSTGPPLHTHGAPALAPLTTSTAVPPFPLPDLSQPHPCAQPANAPSLPPQPARDGLGVLCVIIDMSIGRLRLASYGLTPPAPWPSRPLYLP